MTKTKEIETLVVPPTETERLDNQKMRFFDILKDTFGETSDRYIKLKLMYDEYGDRLTEAPASSKIHYHNAYAGGYIDHVLHVLDCTMEMSRVLKKMHGWVDYTKNEAVMAAIHHDLWKLGIPGGQPYYEVEHSDWHRKNQGAMFRHGEKLPFMKVTDGAVFLLQQRGIELTYNEWMGIKLSDGLYEDSNKGYLMNHGKFPLHTNLGYIIHWADHMSCTAERDALRQEHIESLASE